MCSFEDVGLLFYRYCVAYISAHLLERTLPSERVEVICADVINNVIHQECSCDITNMSRTKNQQIIYYLQKHGTTKQSIRGKCNFCSCTWIH